jgi:sec-independent protein translocase protein TatA
MIYLHVLLGIFGGHEIIVIAVLALLLFGGKKLPDLMRGLGKGIKDVKKAADENDFTKDIQDIGSQINDVTSNVKKFSSPREFLKKKEK